MGRNRMPTARGRSGRPITRQRTWQLQQVAEGRCGVCGRERPPDLGILCRPCQDRSNDYHRRRYYEVLGKPVPAVKLLGRGRGAKTKVEASRERTAAG